MKKESEKQGRSPLRDSAKRERKARKSAARLPGHGNTVMVRIRTADLPPGGREARLGISFSGTPSSPAVVSVFSFSRCSAARVPSSLVVTLLHLPASLLQPVPSLRILPC